MTMMMTNILNIASMILSCVDTYIYSNQYRYGHVFYKMKNEKNQPLIRVYVYLHIHLPI